MRTVLHIQTKADLLAEELIARQRATEDVRVLVVVLNRESSDETYDRLIEQIFAADSIAVW